MVVLNLNSIIHIVKQNDYEFISRFIFDKTIKVIHAHHTVIDVIDCSIDFFYIFYVNWNLVFYFSAF